MQRPKVVIIGGGFAGIAAARVLRHTEVDVVLIDRTNHHVFQPLLYQVATATLAPSDIAVPIRWLLRRFRNARVVFGNVTGIDAAGRRVLVDGDAQAEAYDYLIVAAGARHAYFGNDEWEPLAPGLKSLTDAIEIRRRFLSTFEFAENATDGAERDALQTIVIVGGGPTGVELAGLMTTISHDVMRDDFRRIDTRQTRVLLLEGGSRILPAFPERLSAQALEDVHELGVEVRLNSIVTRIEPDAVYVGDERIPTRAVFWAAGNAASPLGRMLGAPVDRIGRVLVEPDLSVPAHPEVFVVGDLAAVNQPDGRPVPGVAPAANQEGALAARNILRTVRRQPRKPFSYFSKGDLATIGRHRAVADFGRFEFTGVPAWLLWLFVHIMYLVGFRNRLTVLIQWAWAYFAYQRGSRLILGGRGGGPTPEAAAALSPGEASRSSGQGGRGDGVHAPAGHPLRAIALAIAAASLLGASTAGAQWTNRYPRNAGFSHHVYLEGYELPISANGPGDPAPGTASTVVASRGWLWTLDERSGMATRLTNGSAVDSRPAWSPDGTKLAFVRDDSRTLAVVVRDLSTGREVEIDRGMAMDPVFTPDARAVIYANATAGDLDLWRADLGTGSRTRLTTEAGLELRPQVAPDGLTLVYTSKTRGAGDQVRLRSLADGRETVLLSGNIVSQTRPALSPDGRLLAYGWPTRDGWELRLMSLDRPGVSFPLHSRPRGRPLTPAWSTDGRWVYFSEGDSTQALRLYRVAAAGGPAEAVAVRGWEWHGGKGTLVVRTRCSACGSAEYPARLGVTDGGGHPVVPSRGMVRFDGQGGRLFFYSPGTIELEVAAGDAEVRAVRGLATAERVQRVAVPAGGRAEVTLDLEPLWDARRAGYYSGDHHFHLNYGGQFDLAPHDLLPALAGEDLDVGTPMLANLHNRFEDQGFFPWRSPAGGPLVRFAQEVRSHFLGHVGLLGTRDFFWPWVWGPGYEVYGRDDRTNKSALDHARTQGGAGLYVHPVSGTTNPFVGNGLSAIPVALVADAAHGAVDLLEIVCLWSNALGTTELWYRLLNAGFPVAPSGGTDVMTDFHRTMAVGSTRVYVRPEGAFGWESYLDALKAGRSFVTTAPMLDFTIDGTHRPGDVMRTRGGRVRFTLRAASTVPVDSVSLVVNGRTVRALGPLGAGKSATFEGSVAVPSGGWIAVRAVGPAVSQWPSMAPVTFAHTAPVWIGDHASTEPSARRASVFDLLRALDDAERRLIQGYGDAEIPTLREHFAQARAELQRRAR